MSPQWAPQRPQHRQREMITSKSQPRRMFRSTNNARLSWRILSLVVLVGGWFGACVNAQTSFTCSYPSTESTIAIESSDFTIVNPQYVTKNGDVDQGDAAQLLVPKVTHWHIYAIPDDGSPSFSVQPAGWITPQVKDSSLQFMVTPKGLTEQGYSKGDSIQIAVNVYVPISQLQEVNVAGLANKVEISMGTHTSGFNTSSLKIEMSGLENQLFVQAQSFAVDLTVSGADHRAYLHAGGTKPSSVQISGIENRVEMIVDNTTVHDIDMSGIGSYLLLEGNYLQAQLSGVGSTMRVSIQNFTGSGDGCDNVISSGIDSSCQITTTETVTVPTLACLANTTVVKASSWSSGTVDLSTGAIVGVAVGALIGAGLCVFCCLYACGCLRTGGGRNGGQDFATPASPPQYEVPMAMAQPIPDTPTRVDGDAEQGPVNPQETATPAKIY